MALTIDSFITGSVYRMTELLFYGNNDDYANTDIILDIYIRNDDNSVINKAKKYVSGTTWNEIEVPAERILLEDYENLILNENPNFYTDGGFTVNLESVFRKYKERKDLVNKDIYFFIQVGTIKKTKSIKQISSYDDPNIIPNITRFPTSGIPLLVHSYNPFNSVVSPLDVYTNDSYTITGTKYSNNVYNFNVYFNLTKSTLTAYPTSNYTQTMDIYNDETNTLINTYTVSKPIGRYGTRFANVNDSYMSYQHNITTTGNRLPKLRFEMSCSFFSDKLIVYSDNICSKWVTDNLLYLGKNNSIQAIPVTKSDLINLETERYISKTSNNIPGGTYPPYSQSSDVKYGETYTMVIKNIKEVDIDKYKQMLSSTILILEEKNTFRKIVLEDSNFTLLTYKNNKQIQNLTLKYKYI